MSRARESTHAHIVADDLDQAIEDLAREWSTERRERWTIDTDTPAASGDRRRPDLAVRVASGLRAARLRAEQDAVLATLPPDETREVMAAQHEVTRLRTTLDDLHRGGGAFAKTPVGDAYRDLDRSEREVALADQVLATRDLGWKNRRSWARRHRDALTSRSAAGDRYSQLAVPIEAELTVALEAAESGLASLQQRHDDRARRARTIDVSVRLARLEREIGDIGDTAPNLAHDTSMTRARTFGLVRPHPATPVDLHFRAVDVR